MNKNSDYMVFSSLQEANEKLDAIIENSFDGIFITDDNANAIKLNKAYEMITGLKKKDILGKNMFDLIKDNVISVSGSLLAIQKKHPITLQQEFKTGKKAIITSCPVFDKDNKLIMVVTNVRDLTEIYHLKEEINLEKILQMQKSPKKIITTNKEKIIDKIIYADKKSLHTLNMASKVANLDTTVVLLGETGVGKEVYANYIYKNSARKDKPFMQINCGAIPANLVESELFGYEKGAFTGANKEGKAGVFEAINTGTIFLDEIGELPLNMQVKLLRVLQEQQVTRIGSNKPINIDVRIIAATNSNLEEMVENKTFRKDLYYRLMVFPIYIPPLRERREDIIPLANSFVDEFNEKYDFKKYLCDMAIDQLKKYNYPGNIRQLKNIIERAMIISSSRIIHRKDLPFNTNTKDSLTINISSDVDLKDTLEQIELKYILNAYKVHKNVRDSAKSLNMEPSTFARRKKKLMEKYNK